MASNPLSAERQLHASKYLVALIVIAAVAVVLQYTRYALFTPDKTSTLWGVLTGLLLGGFIFGWLRYSKRG